MIEQPPGPWRFPDGTTRHENVCSVQPPNIQAVAFLAGVVEQDGSRYVCEGRNTSECGVLVLTRYVHQKPTRWNPGEFGDVLVGTTARCLQNLFWIKHRIFYAITLGVTGTRLTLTRLHAYKNLSFHILHKRKL